MDEIRKKNRFVAAYNGLIAVYNSEQNFKIHLFAFFAAVYGTAANIFGADAALSVGFPEQKSYSSNGRNLDRLSVGDKSGGSVYDNDPKSPGAAKRRAMLGCKIPSARLRAGMESERECNLRVLDGDSEFMLKVLRKLECPSCPYGIKGA